jgi:fucose permease
VAVNYNSLYVNLVHCFYGLGVAISPFIMGIALSFDNNWELGYRLVFFIQIVICMFAFIAIPLWNKVNKAKEDTVEFTPITLTYKQMAKNPAIKTSWILVFSSVALEFTCGIWGCSFLVGAEFMPESTAAKMLTLYYAGMTIGRLVSGFTSTKLGVMKTVFIGHTLVGLAIIALILPLPPIVKGFTLFFIGFGNGPTFPNLTHQTPIIYGKEYSQSIIGTQMTACNAGIMIMYAITGPLFQALSLNVFPILAVIFDLLMVISFVAYEKIIRKDRKSFIASH